MPAPIGVQSQLRLIFVVAGISVVVMTPRAATATAIYIDEFDVTRSAAPLFDDSFNRSLTLSGGAGTTLPSGVNFAGGGAASYFVHGKVAERTANNGQALVSASNGVLISQPPPFFSKISVAGAVLESGTTTTAAHALTAHTAFTVTGLYDLTLPSVAGGTDALLLTNRYTSNHDIGNVLEIRLRDCTSAVTQCGTLSGPVLQFVSLSYIHDTSTVIGKVALTAAERADPQFEFKFTKAANTDFIGASYVIGSGNTVGTFHAALSGGLGSTNSSTDVFTSTLLTVQPGFETFDPVPPPALLMAANAVNTSAPVPMPEPSSLLPMGSGLLLLAGLARRWGRARHTRADPTASPDL